MARRLEQLHAALGDAEAAPLPATVIKKQVATDNSGNSFGTGTLIITAMISALLGAGMMWLATSGTPAPVNQTFSVKPLPAPPVATVTPLEATLPSPASTEISDKAKVGDMLENWRNAWASRDVAAYLSAYGQQFAAFTDLRALGGVSTKGISPLPRHGNPLPRICETAGGMLNSIGLQGPGISAFCDTDLTWLQSIGAQVVVSIAGSR